jgi:hypothetical protein
MKTNAQELVDRHREENERRIQLYINELERDTNRFMDSSIAYFVAREGKFVYYVNTKSKYGTLHMRYVIRAIRKAGFKVELNVIYINDYEWCITVTLP